MGTQIEQGPLAAVLREAAAGRFPPADIGVGPGCRGRGLGRALAAAARQLVAGDGPAAAG